LKKFARRGGDWGNEKTDEKPTQQVLITATEGEGGSKLLALRTIIGVAKTKDPHRG